jgi:hypothetical protein
MVARLGLLGAIYGIAEGTIRWCETHPDLTGREDVVRLRATWRDARTKLDDGFRSIIAHER